MAASAPRDGLSLKEKMTGRATTDHKYRLLPETS